MAEKLWVRKASGLVRSVSPLDAFAMGVNYSGVGLIAMFMGWSYAWYPHGNPYVAYIFGGIWCMIAMLCYSFLAIALPRSGGDYIFVSRILHPSLGFAFNLLVVWATVMWASWNGYYMSTVGIPTMIGAIGYALKSPGILALLSYSTGPYAQWYTMAIGTAVIMSFMLLVSIQIKHFGRYQSLLVMIIIIGSLLAPLVLFATPRETFVSNFNSAVGANAYQSIIDAGREAGADLTPGYSAYATFALLPVVQTGLGWTWSSTFVAGELKDVKKSNLLAVPVGIVVMIILVVMWYAGLEYSAGREFITAVNYLASYNPAALTLQVPPYVYFFASVASMNLPLLAVIPLIILINLAFPLTNMTAGPMNTVIGVRSMFAWSFDRLFPSYFSKVSDRWHSPYVSAGIHCFIAWLFLWVYTFTPYFVTLSLTGGLIAGMVVVSISCIVLPFLKKEIYEASALSKWHIGKVPVVSVVGAIGFIWVMITEVMMAIDPSYGANNAISLGSLVLTPIGGFIAYWIIRYVRKRQRIDLDLIYAEVPPV